MADAITEVPQTFDIPLSSKVTSERRNWMANAIDISDKRVEHLVNELTRNIQNPTAENLSKAVKDMNIQTLLKLNNDPREAAKTIEKNRKPIKDRFLKGEYPLLGEYFDPDKPANVCQQNVLLLSALGAFCGMEIKVAGFTYTGKAPDCSEKIHAVALFTDPQGKEYVLDPTEVIENYTYMEKDKYLSLFQNPDLQPGTTVFKPKENL